MEGSSLKNFRKEMGERDKRVRKEGAKHAKSEALKKKMESWRKELITVNHKKPSGDLKSQARRVIKENY